jgi:hypothetical protein
MDGAHTARRASGRCRGQRTQTWRLLLRTWSQIILTTSVRFIWSVPINSARAELSFGFTSGVPDVFLRICPSHISGHVTAVEESKQLVRCCSASLRGEGEGGREEGDRVSGQSRVLCARLARESNVSAPGRRAVTAALAHLRG